ncbi:MAG: hypothetical protein E6Q97_24935 [Desulfurellales bacterium]|nr:MAG: hypothetical protein E6Q97_24935 [Desulfurellales bacterium]
MKDVSFGPFTAGMNNKAADYALPKDQYGRQVACRDALNVDFMDNGNFRTRPGRTIVVGYSNAHSLWGDNFRTLFVRDSVLYSVTSFSPYTEVIVKVLTVNDKMSYLAFNGEVWLSNGTDFGRLSVANVWSDHAMPTPTSLSLASDVGGLAAGIYTVAITYSKLDGEESGAKEASIELTTAGSITATLPAGSGGATHINIYLTVENGGIPLYKTQVAVGTANYSITTPATGRALKSRYLKPLPAGRLAYLNGRLLSFKEKVLSFSDPFNLGLHDPVAGYITFTKNISIVAPNQNGVYVAADKTYWISGRDLAVPEQILDTLPYGAITGSEFYHPSTTDVGWYSEMGLVIGTAKGEAKAVQESNVAVDTSASATSLLREVDGVSTVITVLHGTTTKPDLSLTLGVTQAYSVNLTTGATSRYSGVDFNSMTLGHDGDCYGMRSDGLYKLTGELDGASDIVWSVDIGKQNWGTNYEKRLVNGYTGAASNVAISLIVKGEGGEYTYPARASSKTIQQQRFDIGRGLKGSWFAMTLTGSGFVELADFTMPIAVLQRKI